MIKVLHIQNYSKTVVPKRFSLYIYLRQAKAIHNPLTQAVYVAISSTNE